MQSDDKEEDSDDADSDDGEQDKSSDSEPSKLPDKSSSNRSPMSKSKPADLKPHIQSKALEIEEVSKEQLKTPSKPTQKPKRRLTVPNPRQVSQKQKKVISNVLPLADAQEEIGSDQINSSISDQDATNTLGEKNTPLHSQVENDPLPRP